MSQQNVTVAMRAVDAYNQRDLGSMRALADPDMEMDWSASRGVEAGVYKGIDAALRFYQSYFDAFEEIQIVRTPSLMLVSRSSFRTSVVRAVGKASRFSLEARSCSRFALAGLSGSASIKRLRKPSKPWSSPLGYGHRGGRCGVPCHVARVVACATAWATTRPAGAGNGTMRRIVGSARCHIGAHRSPGNCSN
jgi:hypothetical protein